MAMPDNSLPGPSSALSFLKEWAAGNPQSAPIIMGAVACFAATAVIAKFGIDLQANIPNVHYILYIGFILFILTQIIANELLVRTLTWFTEILFFCWVLAFICYKAAPKSATARQQIGCLVYFLKDCQAVADQEAETQVVRTPPSAPLDCAPPKADPVYGKYRVFVQFAGKLDRPSVRAMMQQLKSQGWNVQGVDGGGQRTAAAAGTSEIRYPAGSESAAKELAAIVQSAKLSAEPVGTALNNAVKKDELEVWISR